MIIINIYLTISLPRSNSLHIAYSCGFENLMLIKQYPCADIFQLFVALLFTNVWISRKNSLLVIPGCKQVEKQIPCCCTQMMAKCGENKKVVHKSTSVIIMEEMYTEQNQNVIKKENVFNGDFNDVCSCHPKDDLSNWVYNSVHYIMQPLLCRHHLQQCNVTAINIFTHNIA